jgi:hypothetical protein
MHLCIGQHLAVFEPDLTGRLRGDVEIVSDDHDGDLVLPVETFEEVGELLSRLGVDRAGRASTPMTMPAMVRKLRSLWRVTLRTISMSG